MSPGDTSENNGRSLLPDALRSMTRFAVRRPRATLLTVVIVAFASIWWSAVSLGFKTDRADLIDPGADFQQRWVNYTEQFGGESDIVVVVEAEHSAQVTAAIDALGKRMEREPEHFQNVLYKIDPQTFPIRKGLQFQSTEQLSRGLATLEELRPYLGNQWEQLRIDATFNYLRTGYEQWDQLSSDQQKQLVQQTDRITTSLEKFLDDPSQFESPWEQPLMARLPGRQTEQQRADGSRYFLNRRGTIGFLKAFPVTGGDADDGQSQKEQTKKEQTTDFNGATESIDRLRALIADISSEHPDVTMSVTGIPVLESDEMQRSQTDMLKAAGISFLGVGLLLLIGFRGVRHPALALVMLAIGMAWAFGYTTLIVGHLNILSLSFAVILIGLGIDFAIHYLARYLELRHEGKALRPALLKTSFGVGAGIMTAAITTAFAFFSATLTSFLGVAELGLIAGGGILLCALATFIVLPALIALSDRDVEPRKLPTPFEGNFLRRGIARFPLVVSIVTLLLIAGIGLHVFQWSEDVGNEGRLESSIRYDYNLLNLQADGLESVEAQQRVFDAADHSLLYAVSVANSPEEARRLKASFERLPTVHHVEELASALPEVTRAEVTRAEATGAETTGQQVDPRKVRLIQQYQAMLSRLRAEPPTISVRRPESVGKSIDDFYNVIRQQHHPQCQQIAKRIDQFIIRFGDIQQFPTEEAQQNFIRDYQNHLTTSVHRQLVSLRGMTNVEPVSLSEFPSAIRSRFIGKNGQWLLQVYPKNQIWDAEPLTAFVNDVRSVDSNITGTPIQNLEASRQIQSSYQTAAIYALGAILLVLLIDFLGREYTLLTLLAPLAVVAFTVIMLKTRRMPFDPQWLAVTYVGMAVAIAAIFDFRNLCDALLAMVPPLAGGLVMFGMLALLNIDLNPANLIVLPLVLGIGVDDGVHVIHDYRLQQNSSLEKSASTTLYRMSPSTMNAIALTSLTSMVGFGSMMIAAHRGLYSVGLVLVIGVGSCLFVSLVTLPAVLTLFSRNRQGAVTEEKIGDRQQANQQQAQQKNQQQQTASSQGNKKTRAA